MKIFSRHPGSTIPAYPKSLLAFTIEYPQRRAHVSSLRSPSVLEDSEDTMGMYDWGIALEKDNDSDWGITPKKFERQNTAYDWAIARYLWWSGIKDTKTK